MKRGEREYKGERRIEMGENENFAEKMKKLRAKKKVNIEELANKTGYSKKLLTQIENNEILAPVSVILS
ncbi:MAG: helix-turn-helix domain-containing protein, partial [Planctomycetota bacterium]